MTTKTITDQMHGTTMLFDTRTDTLMRGKLSVIVDTDRAEIRLENDVTGIATSHAFTSPEQVGMMKWFIQAVQDTHTDIDLGMPRIDPVCLHCTGLGEVDDNGTWRKCEMCDGKGGI